MILQMQCIGQIMLSFIRTYGRDSLSFLVLIYSLPMNHLRVVLKCFINIKEQC